MDYDKPQKVRVLETSYNADNDMVLWLLELQNGDRYPFPFHRSRTEEVVNVHLKGVPPPALIEEFNQKMIGKSIMLIVKQMEKKDDNDLRATDCEKCNAVKEKLTKLNVDFKFIDANADENQAIADHYEVDEMPHLIVQDAAGNVIAQHIGDCKGYLIDLETVLIQMGLVGLR